MMATVEPNYAAVEKPDHVPAECVVDYNFHAPLPPGVDHYMFYEELLRDKPEVLWTPQNGGHWIVTRADDIKWVQETYQIFSHEVFIIPRGTVKIVTPPLSYDPPNHARFRAILNPYFTPKKVAAAQQDARALMIELIEKIKARRRCEFVRDFASVLPVVVFLNIVDLPAERREEFLEWGDAFSRAPDQESRDRAFATITGYLKSVLDERHANPGDDLLSKIAAWRDNPRFESEDEVMGLAFNVFAGGQDTVANALSFTVRHLAEHPGHRQRLRDEPEVIPRAVEEYLRRWGQSNTGRLIMEDVEHKGVTMKKGEMVMVPIGCSSIDERRHPDPWTIDFDREDIWDNGRPTHNTFGNGAHKCVGAPLARAEMALFLEEWVTRIPEFRLDPDKPFQAHMNFVPGLDELHLILD